MKERRKRVQPWDVELLSRKSLLGFLGSSGAVAQETRAVDPAVGDPAGPHQHAVAGSAAEEAPAPHGPVVPALGAAQLQAQPEPGSEGGRAQVAHPGHLVGAAQQDLHAHVETHLTVRRGDGGQRVAVETAPALLALRAGTAPFMRRQREK